MSAENSIENERRREFKCNTKGFCFICFQQIGNEDNVGSGSEVPISSLLRYLDINPKQIFSRSFGQAASVMSAAISSLERSEIFVDLCTGCGELGRKASEMVQMLELLQMEVNYALKNIQEWISKGDQSSSRKEEYCDRMKSDIYTLTFFTAFDRLRKSIAEKCSTQVSKAQPKIILKRLAEPSLTPKPSKSSKTANDPSVRQSMPELLEDSPRVLRSSRNSNITGDKDGPRTVVVDADPSEAANTIVLLGPVPEVTGANVNADEVEANIPDCGDVNVELQSNYSSTTTITKYSDADPEEKERRFTCEICQKSFLSAFNLRRHRRGVHHLSKYTCRYAGCSKVTNLLSAITEHEKQSHPELNSETWSSDRVHKRNKTILKPLSHRTEEMVPKSNKYSCTMCAKVFREVYHLKRHFNAVHLMIKYNCSFPGCPKEYSQKDKLDNHEAREHPNRRPNETGNGEDEPPNSKKDGVNMDLNVGQEPLPEEALEPEQLDPTTQPMDTEETPEEAMIFPNEEMDEVVVVDPDPIHIERINNTTSDKSEVLIPNLDTEIKSSTIKCAFCPKTFLSDKVLALHSALVHK